MGSRSFITILAIIFLSFPAAAQDRILVGVAANFMMPFNEIAPAFEKETGIKAEPVFASSGKLYAQIVNGAPYDVFLSADEERPARLFKEGFTDRPVIYAKGEVVLWSLNRDLGGRDWKEAVRSAGVKKIAIANPETAPYGASALTALKAAGLADLLKDKLIYPQDIGQAFQYASTGAVDVGFCALSSTRTAEGAKGCTLAVMEAPKVIQAACIVRATQNRAAAVKFTDFLMSKPATAIKEKYGYR